jgi:hypothetical protein
MWEPLRLTNLGASTACYRDSFIYFFIKYRLKIIEKLQEAFVKHFSQIFFGRFAPSYEAEESVNTHFRGWRGTLAERLHTGRVSCSRDLHGLDTK